MRVNEFMTKEVVSVAADALVRDIARMLIEKGISGVPVVAGSGQVIGMVSQGDLLHRAEVGTERRRKWWLRMLTTSDELAHEYVKAHGLHARDVMTRHVISIAEDADLSQAADLLDRHDVKRLPVLKDGRLIGIITRGDLIRALGQADIVKSSQKRDNAEIRRAVEQKLRAQGWLRTDLINFTVKDGVVNLAGFIQSDAQRTALCVLMEETDGVTRVEDHLTVGIPHMGV